MSRDKEWYRASTSRRDGEAHRDSQRAAREEPASTPRSRRSPSSQGTATEEQKAARTVDGTFNDLKCPMMGATGARFGRNVPLTETFPDTANLLNPNPRDISHELFTRNDVPARHHPQRAGGGVDPVPGARLVRARARARRDDAYDICRSPTTTPGPSGRCACRRRRSIRRRWPDSDAPAGLRQRELALVGRLAGLRQHRGRAGDAAHRHGRQDQGAGRRPPVPRRRPRAPRSPACTRQRWVGLSLLHGLFALRAQRDLRQAQARRTRRGTTSGCSSRRASSTRR